MLYSWLGKNLCTFLVRGAVIALQAQVCALILAELFAPHFADCILHFACFLVQLIPLLYQSARDKQIYNKLSKEAPS